MNFEPQKFFIGLIDFFSIILPGALLTYVAAYCIYSDELCKSCFSLIGPNAWVVFLFASYLSGHLIFLFGSKLDDFIYTPLRNSTYLGQINRLAKGKKIFHPIWRNTAKSKWFFGKDADAAVMQVYIIKSLALQKLSMKFLVNAFQWSKAYLSKEHPNGLAKVERFEADSKFFRSFCVVLAVLFVLYLFQKGWIEEIICLVLLVPAIWRYIDQRFKATQEAYWHVLMLESINNNPISNVTPQERDDHLTHAGGIVYYKINDTIKYLLVQSKDRKEWVLPKGHIEPGEEPKETAVREVKEECGYSARVITWINDIKLASGENDLGRFYLMELQEVEMIEKIDKKWLPEERQHKWLTLEEAKNIAKFDDTKELLDKSEDFINNKKG